MGNPDGRGPGDRRPGDHNGMEEEKENNEEEYYEEGDDLSEEDSDDDAEIDPDHVSLLPGIIFVLFSVSCTICTPSIHHYIYFLHFYALASQVEVSADIKNLESEVRDLLEQVAEMRGKCEQAERRDQERGEEEGEKHKAEVRQKPT